MSETVNDNCPVACSNFITQEAGGRRANIGLPPTHQQSCCSGSKCMCELQLDPSNPGPQTTVGKTLSLLDSAIWVSVSFHFQEYSSLSNFSSPFPLIYFKFLQNYMHLYPFSLAVWSQSTVTFFCSSPGLCIWSPWHIVEASTGLCFLHDIELPRWAFSWEVGKVISGIVLCLFPTCSWTCAGFKKSTYGTNTVSHADFAPVPALPNFHS